ncbi:RNA-binding protein squid [Aethina tumida]|uniref:RNA-binding protein squid n=1 Tax=Aethina tumida TaxID=116153 RepID=UPI002148DC1E|nr:RNA-binding protein squid [Aethina tumida]XP_049822992.1 RNA-binding protein squid [Aethina tumida]
MESNGQETSVAPVPVQTPSPAPAEAPSPAPVEAPESATAAAPASVQAPTSTTTDSALRKIFVGGLSQDTTEVHIKEYFSKYGSIEAIRLKTDPNTGNSKGFAFVVFASPEPLEAIFAKSEHTINNKKVDVQKANIKEGKLFVGGITAEMSEDEIKEHFGQFGKVIKAEFPIDKTKNQRKAFCFITFESDSSVNQIARTKKQTIKGKEVDVKKALCQDKAFGNGFAPNNGHFAGGRGRGGRGRGFQGRRGAFMPRGNQISAQVQGNGWTSFGDCGGNYLDFGYDQGFGGNGAWNGQGYGGYVNGTANGGIPKPKASQQRFQPY